MTLTQKQKGGIAALAGAVAIVAAATLRKKPKAKPPVAEITLSNLSITPTTVSPGETVTISVLATNHSDSPLATTIKLTGDFTDSADITLDAGASQTVTFTVIPTVDKIYHVSVDSLSGSFICTSTPQGNIQLSDLTISPETCKQGDTVTISVTATNVGNANQVMGVTLSLVGSKYYDSWQETHQIALEPGGSRIVSFTFQPTVAETYTVTVDGLSGSFVVNAAATWPGWTPDTVVYELSLTPSTLYLGETVTITVDIEGPWPATYPMNIEASINIDGTTLSKVFTIEFRNPGLVFTYTPTKLGQYTVTAQDKTATFTVLANPSGTYYSPFGGARMPRCTDIVVPNVAPFSLPWWEGGYTHPGGDFIWSSLFHDISYFWLPPDGYSEIKAQLSQAQPIKWEPAGAVVSSWVTYFQNGSIYSLTVMAVDYTCQEYWDSKDELATMIATGLGTGGISIPTDWIITYGTTCPVCGGTGKICYGPYWCTKCYTCGGLGKILKVDLARGLRDWVYPIRFSEICGSGWCTPQIYCPYCDKPFKGSAHVQGEAWDKLSFARSFLEHIETAHPDHPLTQPAWF